MIIGFVVKKTPERCLQPIGGTDQNRALSHFPWLSQLSLKVGNTEISFWGHGELEKCIHHQADGALLALIGSPVKGIPLDQVEVRLNKISNPEDFHLPWDGRVILLKISANGDSWTMWNDWAGSIPVFHAKIGQCRLASTLETLVVANAGYTAGDFFWPGLVSLLINGHYLKDWTLFKGMNILPPDCAAEWNSHGFRWRRLWTVKPSDERWNRGWDELVEEMHELSRKAIADVLTTRSSWILPLSGGLDSRLMAAVGTEMGMDMHCYTYGPSAWNETVYARQVAKALGLPWKNIDLGTDYLARYTRMWADWFGSALHFHGMYQMPFLESLKAEPPGPILQGYMGDPLAGNHLLTLVATHSNHNGHRLLTNAWVHWSPEQVKALFKFSIDEAIDQVQTQIESEINTLEGEWFHRLMFLDFWNRQRLFIYYQPTMYDYWRGVGTPFFNVDYARFCLSLPRLALEDRRLQRELFQRFYPKLAAIPGTYSYEPFLLTGRYILKRGVVKYIPKPFLMGPFREFNPLPNTLDTDCLKAGGEAALWPIGEAWDQLSEWLNMDIVRQTMDFAVDGDLPAVNRLEALQALAYRLLDNPLNVIHA